MGIPPGTRSRAKRLRRGSLEGSHLKGDESGFPGGPGDWAGSERRRLAVHPAGAGGGMAAKPTHGGQHPVGIPVFDVDGVGSGADVLLQRRLSPRHPGPQVPLGARPSRQRGVGGDLDRHRPTDRGGPVNRGGDLGRGPDADPGAVGLPRGDISHVLLQPVARRGGARGRHAVRGERGHRPGDR